MFVIIVGFCGFLFVLSIFYSFFVYADNRMARKPLKNYTVQTFCLELIFHYKNCEGLKETITQYRYPGIAYIPWNSSCISSQYRFEGVTIYTATSALRHVRKDGYLYDEKVIIPVDQITCVKQKFVPFKMKFQCKPPAFGNKILVGSKNPEDFIEGEESRTREYLKP